jgi:hypothetical protein
VYLLEHGDVLIYRSPGSAPAAAHGRVHPVIARGRQLGSPTWRVVAGGHGHPASFGIGILTLILNTLVWVFVVHKDYGVETRPSGWGGNAAPPLACELIHDGHSG